MITRFNKIKFRVFLEDKPELFGGAIVKEIIFHGNNGETRIFEFVETSASNRKDLLEVVTYGSVNLYESRNEYFTNGRYEGVEVFGDSRKINETTFYLKREEEKKATRAGFNFKKMAKIYFEDCDIIQELLNSGEYKKLSKKEIVDEYNVFCTD